MSKPVNPVAIGGFTVGALALLLVGIFAFSGGQLFKTDKIRYVVFFESSLNGLEIGAPVKMQGVKIGEVTEIKLQIDATTGKLYKPVIIEIDRNSLSSKGGNALPVIISKEQLIEERNKLVASGFRARLEIQSLLTGLLYVDLDIHSDKVPIYVGLEYKGLLEIPGVLATTDEIRNTAQQLTQKLQSLPIDEIIRNFSLTLDEIRRLVASEEVKKSTIALANTLTETEKFMTTLNENVMPLLQTTHHTIGNANQLVTDVHKNITPLLSSANQTLQAATRTLNETEHSVVTANAALGPTSPLNDTLKAVRDAARSLKNLTDYLERHPESLISGKAP